MRISKVKLSVAMARNDMNFIKLASQSGVSRTTLSYINSGKNCKPEVASRISKALGVDITEIIEEG